MTVVWHMQGRMEGGGIRRLGTKHVAAARSRAGTGTKLNGSHLLPAPSQTSFCSLKLSTQVSMSGIGLLLALKCYMTRVSLHPSLQMPHLCLELLVWTTPDVAIRHPSIADRWKKPNETIASRVSGTSECCMTMCIAKLWRDRPCVAYASSSYVLVRIWLDMQTLDIRKSLITFCCCILPPHSGACEF
jgi:hypothetical protein